MLNFCNFASSDDQYCILLTSKNASATKNAQTGRGQENRAYQKVENSLRL